jgi:hypothetical protein
VVVDRLRDDPSLPRRKAGIPVIEFLPHRADSIELPLSRAISRRSWSLCIFTSVVTASCSDSSIAQSGTPGWIVCPSTCGKATRGWKSYLH